MARARTTRRPVPTQLDIESFRYLDDLNVALPALILGIEVPEAAFRPDSLDGLRYAYTFQPGRQWLRIAHQYGPAGRRSAYYLATLLKSLDSSTQTRLEMLAGGYRTDITTDGTLYSVNAYDQDLRDTLAHRQINCNHSWRDFDLGRYPIDLEHLPVLTADKLPANLDDLIEWQSGTQRAAGSVGRWKLLLLGAVPTT